MNLTLLRTGVLTLLAAGLPTLTQADVHYATENSAMRDGKLTPMNLTSTWNKTGLERMDSKVMLGAQSYEEITIRNRARREQITADPKLKLYVVDALDANGIWVAPAVDTTQLPGGKPSTGKVVLTLNAKMINTGTLIGYPVRHFETTTKSERSGCCGTGETSSKTEVWMADIKLPVFADYSKYAPSMGYSRPDCIATVEQKGNVAAFNNAQKGLPLKTLIYGDDGKIVMQMRVTELSLSPLSDSVFALPPGYKKVSRAEFDAARQKAMMDGMTSGRNGGADEPETPAAPFAPAAQPVAAAKPVSKPALNPAQTPALLDAAGDGKWEAARAALEAGADPNAADKKGVSVLMRASAARQDDLVSRLIELGANPNAADRDGRTALHYAVPEGPKKKKKGLFGSIGGALAGNIIGGNLDSLANNPLGASLLGQMPLDNLLGSNLQGLLSASSFNLGGKSNWMAIVGTALQGDANGKLGVANLLNGSAPLNAGGWTSLLSSVKGGNPQVLSAMSNLGGGNAAQSALWGQFLNAASSGDEATVATLMKKPQLAPLLAQASSGLNSASGELPGNQSRSVVSALLKAGAQANAADKKGTTPGALAKERNQADLVELLGA